MAKKRLQKLKPTTRAILSDPNSRANLDSIFRKRRLPEQLAKALNPSRTKQNHFDAKIWKLWGGDPKVREVMTATMIERLVQRSNSLKAQLRAAPQEAIYDMVILGAGLTSAELVRTLTGLAEETKSERLNILVVETEPPTTAGLRKFGDIVTGNSPTRNDSEASQKTRGIVNRNPSSRFATWSDADTTGVQWDSLRRFTEVSTAKLYNADVDVIYETSYKNRRALIQGAERPSDKTAEPTFYQVDLQDNASTANQKQNLRVYSNHIVNATGGGRSKVPVEWGTAYAKLYEREVAKINLDESTLGGARIVPPEKLLEYMAFSDAPRDEFRLNLEQVRALVAEKGNEFRKTASSQKVSKVGGFRIESDVPVTFTYTSKNSDGEVTRRRDVDASEIADIREYDTRDGAYSLRRIDGSSEFVDGVQLTVGSKTFLMNRKENLNSFFERIEKEFPEPLAKTQLTERPKPGRGKGQEKNTKGPSEGATAERDKSLYLTNIDEALSADPTLVFEPYEFYKLLLTDDTSLTVEGYEIKNIIESNSDGDFEIDLNTGENVYVKKITEGVNDENFSEFRAFKNNEFPLELQRADSTQPKQGNDFQTSLSRALRMSIGKNGIVAIREPKGVGFERSTSYTVDMIDNLFIESDPYTKKVRLEVVFKNRYLAPLSYEYASPVELGRRVVGFLPNATQPISVDTPLERFKRLRTLNAYRRAAETARTSKTSDSLELESDDMSERRRKDLVIIGAGDNAKTVIEALVGQAISAAYTGNGKVDSVSRGPLNFKITWVSGNKFKECSEFVDKIRARYLRLTGLVNFEFDVVGTDAERVSVVEPGTVGKTLRVELRDPSAYAGLLLADMVIPAVGQDPDAALQLLNVSQTDIEDLVLEDEEGEFIAARQVKGENIFLVGPVANLRGSLITTKDETFESLENAGGRFVQNRRLPRLAELWNRTLGRVNRPFKTEEPASTRFIRFEPENAKFSVKTRSNRKLLSYFVEDKNLLLRTALAEMMSTARLIRRSSENSNDVRAPLDGSEYQIRFNAEASGGQEKVWNVESNHGVLGLAADDLPGALILEELLAHFHRKNASFTVSGRWAKERGEKNTYMVDPNSVKVAF